jgi:hypothetical protein
MVETWRWHSEPRPSGATVVVDVDGVVSDATSRQHFLEGELKDWRGFFEACGEDMPIEEVGRLLSLLDSSLVVVLLTARPIRVRPQTLAWLERYGVRWDLLIMREEPDFGLGHEFKRRSVRRLRESGYDVRLAFEDDRRNAAMFREEGIPCVYIHSGYYD